jgi:PBP4 family serine-type D-alanyl-D-alanine carboxypeptidase
MRHVPLLVVLFSSLSVMPAASKPAREPEKPPPAPASASDDDSRPYGIDRRVLWTNERVIGSPNPPPPFRVRQTFTKLKIPCPIGVAREPGTDNLLLIHQMVAWSGHGKILRVKDDPETDQTEELLNLDGIAYGVAFHPDFEKNGYLYVGDNGPMEKQPKKTRVTRYTIDRKPPHKIVPGSARIVIEWESDGHNGGDVAFGTDGMLYVTSGDGTSDSDTNVVGQDLTRLLSKVLRIDVDHPDPGKEYSVPKDNPFLDTPGARPETWAYGFRNPWRIHIDQKTGDVWVGQNGQDLWEQAILVQRGANYGWSVTEGSHPFYPDRKRGPTPISPPTVEHHHSEFRSLTGGVVYHGEKFPELRGAYIYGDWSTGKIWGVKHDRGKVTWHKELASTTLQITGFGIDTHGELLIADHGGGYYQLEPWPKDYKPAKFPTKLSETGLFTSVKGHEPHPGLIPYSVNAPLWSDGAEKERFIALPGAAQIEFGTWRGWNFPDLTVLVKTFSLPVGKDGMRRIETRLLTRQDGQWYGYSYLWNDEQTDADLVTAEGQDRVYEVRDAEAPGGVRQQTWHYPSRTECMVCHSRAANWVLGLTELQMNRVHDYGKVKDNQLRTLEHLGVFKVNPDDHVQALKQVPEPLLQLSRFIADAGQRAAALFGSAPAHRVDPVAWLEKQLRTNPRVATVLPKRPEEYRRLADPYDPKEDLDKRARSYLQANCAQCHVEAGGGNAQIDLEFTTARDRMKAIDVKPLHDTFGVRDAKLIAPGDPDRSVLLQRVMRRGAGQMPQLATAMADREGVKLLSGWIRRMEPERSAEQLDARIKAVITGPDYKHSRWGILAVDVETGKPVYEHNADQLFAPASVTKLYSCAAALVALGADHRFETPVFRRGDVTEGRLQGDLILVARGDLTLGGRIDADGKMAFKDHDHIYASPTGTQTEVTDTDPLAGLKALARQVKEAGINRVEGDVLIDDRLFAQARGSGSGPSIVTPILVNDNIVDVLVTPSAQAGQPASVRLRPETPFVQVDAQVETSGAGTRARITTERVGPQRYTVRGQVPVDAKPQVRILPVDDPAEFARALFIEALRREGVAVRASELRTPTAELPEKDAVAKLPRVAVFTSPPLSEALKVTLKVSHNLYASTLPLLLAVKEAKRTQPEGMRVERKILADLGVDVASISLESGAGGGNGDRVSPRATVQLLLAMGKRPDFATFKAALPVLGVDGTLADAVPADSPARGQVFAKTGTYGDADLLNDRVILRSKSVAGVMTTAGGRNLAFAIFVNEVPLPKGVEPAREGKVIGKLCEIIYRHAP